MSKRPPPPPRRGPVVWRPPGPISRAYLLDNHSSIIQGPVGSGKTLTSFMKFLRHASEQEPGRDGVRRSVWIFCRTDFPELMDTTFKQFVRQFPEGEPEEGGFGLIKRSPPPVYYFKYNDVEAEIHFMAFADMDAAEHIKSMNITGAFINEMQFFRRDIIDILRERCGRYPDPFTEGVSPTWYGFFGDMNAPYSLHWVPVMRGDVEIPPYIKDDQRGAYEMPIDPDTGEPLIRFFTQPPGLIEVKDATGKIKYKTNPIAENLANLEALRPNYYLIEAQGKPRLYVETQILGRPAALRGGSPVHPDYDDHRHYIDANILPDPRFPLFVGIDFGIHFAATAAQCVDGQWRFLYEIYLDSVPNGEQAKRLRRDLFEKFPHHMSPSDDGVSKVKIFGDPSGDFGTRHAMNDFAVFRAHGLEVMTPPGGNRFEPKEGADQHGSYRKTAMDHVLVTTTDKKPDILLTKATPLLREGMRSGYVWEQSDKRGITQSREKVVKNIYSHVVESAQYLLIGGGAGEVALGRDGSVRVVDTRAFSDPFDRGRNDDMSDLLWGL